MTPPLRKIRTALVMGPANQALAIEAAACLLVARLALALLPFGRIAPRLGTFVPPGDPRTLAHPSRRAAKTARRIRWAVTTTAAAMPFRAACLQQAMAARAMLHRRGVASVMHFGVARGEHVLTGEHAWLDAAGVEVTGFPLEARVIELGCFV